MIVLRSAIRDKAYAEIDAIVGGRSDLRYLMIDWCYPKSTVLSIFANGLNQVYSCSPNDGDHDGHPLSRSVHDASKYLEPFEFVPERFLHSDGTLTPDNVQNNAFGLGRRSSSGDTLWRSYCGICGCNDTRAMGNAVAKG